MEYFIKEIKDSMQWYGFYLNDLQIKEYLEENQYNIQQFFDTLEQDKFADYLALKITGMKFPTYANTQEYLKEFEELLIKNSKKLGYKWNCKN